MFFESWQGLLRVLLVGVPAYAAVVLVLRISGKRTLSKMNAFDFVVTIALGSILGTTLISDRVPLVEGLLALGLLIALQYALTWLSVRSPRVRRLVRSAPRLLYYRGEFLERELRRERVTHEEVEAAIRDRGFGSADQVAAVILETDGTAAVIPRRQDQRHETLRSVMGKPEELQPE